MGNNYIYISLIIILLVIMMILYSYHKRLRLVKITKKEIEKVYD